MAAPMDLELRLIRTDLIRRENSGRENGMVKEHIFILMAENL